MLRLSEETRKRLIGVAKRYTGGDYQLFEDELGWEDWMNDFTDAPEGELVPERDIEEINNILMEIFDLVHEDDSEPEEDCESEEWSEEELREVLSDFFESCIRTGHYNMEENAEYFCRENSNVDVSYHQVLFLLEQLEEERSV